VLSLFSVSFLLFLLPTSDWKGCTRISWLKYKKKKMSSAEVQHAATHQDQPSLVPPRALAPAVFVVVAGPVDSAAIVLHRLDKGGLRAVQVDPPKAQSPAAACTVKLDAPAFCCFDSATDVSAAVASSFAAGILSQCRSNVYPFNAPPTNQRSKPLESQVFLRLGASIRFRPFRDSFSSSSSSTQVGWKSTNPASMTENLGESEIGALRSALVFATPTQVTKELCAYISNVITEEKFRVRIDLNRLSPAMNTNDLFAERVVSITGEKTVIRRNVLRAAALMDATAVMDFREDVTEQFATNTALMDQIVKAYQKWLSVAGCAEQRLKPFSVTDGPAAATADSHPQFQMEMLRLVVTTSYKVADGVSIQFSKVREAERVRKSAGLFHSDPATPPSASMMSCRAQELMEVSLVPADAAAKILHDHLAEIRARRDEDGQAEARVHAFAADLTEFLRTSLIELKRFDAESPLSSSSLNAVIAEGGGVVSHALSSQADVLTLGPVVSHLSSLLPPVEVASGHVPGSSAGGASVDSPASSVTSVPHSEQQQVRAIEGDRSMLPQNRGGGGSGSVEAAFQASLGAQLVYESCDLPQTIWGHRMLLESIVSATCPFPASEATLLPSSTAKAFSSCGVPREAIIASENAATSFFGRLLPNSDVLKALPSTILRPSPAAPLFRTSLGGVFLVSTTSSSPAVQGKAPTPTIVGALSNVFPTGNCSRFPKPKKYMAGFISTPSVLSATRALLGVVGTSVLLTPVDGSSSLLTLTSLSETEFLTKVQEAVAEQAAAQGAAQQTENQEEAGGKVKEAPSPISSSGTQRPAVSFAAMTLVEDEGTKHPIMLVDRLRFGRQLVPACRCRLQAVDSLGGTAQLPLLNIAALLSRNSSEEGCSPGGGAKEFASVTCRRGKPTILEACCSFSDASFDSVVEGLPVFAPGNTLCGFVGDCGSTAAGALPRTPISSLPEKKRGQKKGQKEVETGEMGSGWTGANNILKVSEGQLRIPFTSFHQRQVRLSRAKVEASMKQAIYLAITRH
jgi:hypothetical protein